MENFKFYCGSLSLLEHAFKNSILEPVFPVLKVYSLWICSIVLYTLLSITLTIIWKWPFTNFTFTIYWCFFYERLIHQEGWWKTVSLEGWPRCFEPQGKRCCSCGNQRLMPTHCYDNKPCHLCFVFVFICSFRFHLIGLFHGNMRHFNAQN